MTPDLSRQLATLMTLGEATVDERLAVADAAAPESVQSIADLSAPARAIVSRLRHRAALRR